METERSEDRLRSFIEAARAQGASDEFLVDLLKSGGWPEKNIFSAFREYYEGRTGVALPARGSAGESAKEAFLHLLAFSTLATWAGALGSLLFTFINRWFPDPLTYRSYDSWAHYSVANEVACMVVAFPVFLMVSRSIAASTERPDSGVRRWLTYIALLITAVVMICDVITLLAFLLRGELTTPFVLKVIVVFAIAGGIFGYYYESMRAERVRFRRWNVVFAVVASIAVIAGVLSGFGMLGTPGVQRNVQADMQRVRDLHAITGVLSSNSVPPADQAEFERRIRGRARANDPLTGTAYEYVRNSDTEYELCATFSSDNLSEQTRRAQTFWLHPAGRHCFGVNVKEGSIPYPY